MLGNLGLELWFNWRQALIYNKEWISLLDLLTLDSAETEKKKLSGGSAFSVCNKQKCCHSGDETIKINTSF